MRLVQQLLAESPLRGEWPFESISRRECGNAINEALVFKFGKHPELRRARLQGAFTRAPQPG